MRFKLTPSTTERGFRLFNFKDLYGHGCSVQDSSLASDEAIWLGIDDPQPEIMASKAAAYGVDTDQRNGWVPFPIPEDVLMHTRMHLNRDQARALIDVLSVFVETGELPDEQPERASLSTSAPSPSKEPQQP